MTIFAYGSNMSTARLRLRVPSANPLDVGCLGGHALRWHKRSVDGSGKCDAEETRDLRDSVWGVLFQIDPAHKKDLDRFEFLGTGYAEKRVAVSTPTGPVEACLYYAIQIDRALLPYRWYKAFVVAGAIEHSLPLEYIGALKAAPSRPDPDRERAAMNRCILGNT